MVQTGGEVQDEEVQSAKGETDNNFRVEAVI